MSMTSMMMNTPLYNALKYKHKHAVKMLFEKGAILTNIKDLVYLNLDTDIWNIVFDHITIDYMLLVRDTIHITVYHQHIQLMMNRGLISKQTQDKNGNTILHLYALYGRCAYIPSTKTIDMYLFNIGGSLYNVLSYYGYRSNDRAIHIKNNRGYTYMDIIKNRCRSSNSKCMIS